MKDRLFCNLPPQALVALDAISSTATYPKGTILFVEDQEPRGAFVICNGRVKLSASSARGKSLILRIADEGEVVGSAGFHFGKTLRSYGGSAYTCSSDFYSSRCAFAVPARTMWRGGATSRSNALPHLSGNISRG